MTLQAMLTNLTPVAPVIDSVDKGSYSIYMAFMLIARNTDGATLNPKGMGFRLYNDDGLVTLDDSYTHAGDMSFIPWGFEGYDIYGYSDGWFSLNWQDMADDQNLWIVAVNIVDGKEYVSEPTALLGTVAVKDIKAETVTTQFYDMQGRPLQPGEKGMVIAVRTYSDGSRSVAKTIVK